MTPLEAKLCAELGADGSMPFAAFMAAALYTPNLGYYERSPERIGRGGDFYTSVSVGPVFGELLAVHLAGGWRETPAPRVQVVELGPHDGRLAADLLDALDHHAPDLAPRIEYLLVEDSPTRRAWQAERLARHSHRVRWIPGLDALAPGSVCGVIFSNEFFDALPVHRLVWDANAGAWTEWRVGRDGGRWVWVRPQPGDPHFPLSPPVQAALEGELGGGLTADLLAVLPDGFTVEVRPVATALWTAAARALGAGRLLTLDYGYDLESALRPERPAGTLRAYARHVQAPDPLASPGEQDLTAEVNFTALRAAGERAGLATEVGTSQAAFLTGIAREHAGAAAWSADQRRQFLTLVHPHHFGERFRVLGQVRLGR